MEHPMRIVKIVSLILVIILGGCSIKSEENAIQDTIEVAENTFKNDTPIEANRDLNNISLYLPKRLEVEDEDDSNIILEDGDQTYIIFYNNIENQSSQLNYSAAQNDKALALESFSNDKKFGYIRILPDEGEDYELQIGVGGVKITTYTTKDKMDNDAEELMKIARSIAVQHKNN